MRGRGEGSEGGEKGLTEGNQESRVSWRSGVKAANKVVCVKPF